MICNIPLNKIQPNPYQPESRLQVPGDVAEKFGKSILEHGLMQTPVARQRPVNSSSPGLLFYEMGDGWLRLAGYKWLNDNGHGYAQIPLDVRDLTDDQMADMVMEANSVRQELSPIDKAHFYRECLNRLSLTQTKLAERYKVSQGEIANTLRLLELPKDIQAEIISRKITETHALKLIALKDWPGLLQELVKKIIATGMSTAALDEEVRQITNREKKPRKATPAADKPVVTTTPPLDAMPKDTQEALVDMAKKAVEQIQDEAELTKQAKNIPENIPEKLQSEADKAAAGPEPAQIISAEVPQPANNEKPLPLPAKPVAPCKWKRKLILEEVGEVRISIMTLDQKHLFIKRLPGSIESMLEQLPGILNEANEKWEGK